MIYLIGGPPRCGKTTVARRLAAVTGASWLTLDHVESVISHYLPEDERAVAMPRLPELTNNDRYAAHPVPEIIAILRTCAWVVWPATHILVHFALEQGKGLIIEGYHIEPRFMAEFTPTGEEPGQDGEPLSVYQAAMVRRGAGYTLAHAGDERIRAVFLYREDLDDIMAGITRGDDANDWITGQDTSAVTLRRIASMISQYSGFVRDEAATLRVAAYNMDYAFDSQVERALAYLTGSQCSCS